MIESKTDSKVDELPWCSVVSDEHAAGILSTARTLADGGEDTLCNPVCANFSHPLPRLDAPHTWIGSFAFLADTRLYSNCTATRIFLLNLM
jgi:hypothetical protein